MSKKSAADNIINFLKENPSWFASGDLQRREWRNKNNSLATPRSIVRRLEESAEGPNAILEVKYEGNHAWYRIKQQHRKIKFTYIDLPNGSKKQIASYA